jgi:serine/threonine-protein kinase RsbW
MFPARFEQLRVLRAFLEAFCAQAAIGEDNCLRLNLVLEELFTNTVKHGHGGGSDAPVWLTLTAGERQIKVTYEDSAPAFNPYARLPESAPDITLEPRAAPRTVGGLGVLLTRRLAASRDYAYLYGRNCIRLALSLE